MRRAARLLGGLLAAAAAAGCVAGEQGRATAPAAGFTVEVHGDQARIWIGLWGDGNASGTAAPDTATGDQAVEGHDLEVPVR